MGTWAAVSKYAYAAIGTKIFAATDNGVYVTTNNGTSWTEANFGLTGQDVLTLAASEGNLFAGTYGLNGTGGAGGSFFLPIWVQAGLRSIQA